MKNKKNYSNASEILFKKSYNKNFVKIFLNNLYVGARFLNDTNILELFTKDSKARLIDLGCDDGNFTRHIVDKIQTKKAYGLDIVSNRLTIAKNNKIKTIKADLNKKLPIKNDSFTVVHANQVIEHVTDLDNFVYEIWRILEPGGYAVISTENASSWCNIFALAMGWQMFSLTNFSKKSWGLGNPLTLHKDERPDPEATSWNHKTILSIRGLKELFEIYDFKVEKIVGAGYFPLPNILGKIDKTHAHFMTFKIRKPKQKNKKN